MVAGAKGGSFAQPQTCKSGGPLYHQSKFKSPKSYWNDMFNRHSITSASYKQKLELKSMSPSRQQVPSIQTPTPVDDAQKLLSRAGWPSSKRDQKITYSRASLESIERLQKIDMKDRESLSSHQQ